MSDKTLAQRLEAHAQMHAELAASTGDTEQSGFAADLREAIAELAKRDGRLEQHSRDSAELRRLCAARDAYKAERDALRADAERLDWVGAQAIQIEDECSRDSGRWSIDWAGGSELTCGDTIRSAIDAARGAS